MWITFITNSFFTNLQVHHSSGLSFEKSTGYEIHSNIVISVGDFQTTATVLVLKIQWVSHESYGDHYKRVMRRSVPPVRCSDSVVRWGDPLRCVGFIGEMWWLSGDLWWLSEMCWVQWWVVVMRCAGFCGEMLWLTERCVGFWSDVVAQWWDVVTQWDMLV